ncbi:hypothetical protein [Bacillus cereus]|uniref:hypothetical protein n=1 Tax=Bacillus cereus TaxID=1396 RepID=UPI00084C4FCC|nr:hypothetical protein [Bacillus cereus]OED05361.1 hypothetical protein A9756_08265 [Bacillus cereus]
MNKTASKSGLFAGVGSIILWIFLVYYNLYAEITRRASFYISVITLLLPATFAIAGTFLGKKSLMFLAFLWSLPASLYFVLTPSIFILFGLTCFTYFFSYLQLRDQYAYS